jgi:hypothetical protein
MLGYSPAEDPIPGNTWGEGRETVDCRVLAVALLLLLAAAPASSQEREPVASKTSTGDAPQVDLDQLLKLPSTLDYSVEKRGGFTPGEWRTRFQELRTALAAERDALELAESDLERIAGSADAWQVGPPMPGMTGGSAEAPLDFRIRQAINRHRQEIDRLERQLRELEVEANLAMVPEDWRS